ncbi:hypothetical protein [Shewanella waksmanii]|uniref:hypothetical protein n=1 Tax=Shewanella waksmanii TaxID=213783 RepID=UPI00048ADDB2|nr:hypothetical protein [Shewanella waksmanii]
MRYILILAATLLCHTATAHSSSTATCPTQANSQAYQATYQVQRSDGGEHQLILTRFNDTIRYQSHDSVFEQWNLQGEFSRYFANHMRSVTYTRGDLKSLHRVPNIAQKFHLIAPDMLAQFSKGSEHNQGCFTVTDYHSTEPQEVKLQWIAQLQLPYSLNYQNAAHQVRFTLANVTPITAADFNAVATGYRDIDFADIGDNESDPFIAKMINQGFIEHGSSGFYRSNGQSLGGSSHHHSH